MVIYTTMDTYYNRINNIAINDENGVTNVTEETSVLEKFKAAAIAIIAEKQITISSISRKSSTYDDDAYLIVEKFVNRYIDNISPNDQNSMICEFGMTKAFRHAYIYYTIGGKCTPEQFWEVMSVDNRFNLAKMVSIGILMNTLKEDVGLTDEQVGLTDEQIEQISVLMDA